MIDFTNGVLAKLSMTDNDTYRDRISAFLTEDEEIIISFHGFRDGTVFTNKRIIAINVQGVSGKKVSMSSIPYANIQCFAIETAGIADIDSELALWVAGLGRVLFEFTSDSPVDYICQILSEHIL